MPFQSLFDSAKKRKRDKAKETKILARDSNPHHGASKAQKATTSKPHADNYTHVSSRGSPGPRQNVNSGNRKRKRGPVSQDALALSARLKDLSRQKRLDQVLQLYWNAKDRDAHHACMVIDCCARCGDVVDAERVFRQAMSDADNNSPAVEVHTAMLKAYAHAGQMAKADELFSSMCQPQSRVIPNVRTLNTILRGCLWTAASLQDDGAVVGGVVTSERAWTIYKNRVGGDSLDASSYEYSISLLCQALRVQDALDRIDEFNQRNLIALKGKASFRGGDHTALETLAIAYLAMAKAYGLLGQWEDTWTACQRVLNAVEGSRAKLVAESATTASVKESTGWRQQATGGKKSWSRETGPDAQRQASNSSFRSHRLSELEMEARTILKMRSDDMFDSSKASISQRLVTGLLCFSGGGTTELATVKEQRNTAASRIEQQRRLLIPVWHSFGLSSLVRGSIDHGQEALTELDPVHIYRTLGLDKVMKKMINKDGRIEIDRLFPDPTQPIDVELGCGFGEWIGKQAQTNQKRNYIAVELRADRVFQIFTKSALLLGLRNVCVVAADSASFLQSHVPPSRISNVFVNHPEPPTQTLGDNTNDINEIMAGGDEPAHMLCSSTLQAIAQALVSGGKLSIISDNRSFARLICATVAKANLLSECKLMPPTPVEAKDLGLQVVETFENGATMYRSLPRSNASNGGEGLTWFDRLWQTGAGKHAERTTRYAVIVNKQ